MNQDKPRLLKDVLEQGVGTAIEVQTHSPGLREGLRAWFDGLTANQGPVFSIVPSGLRRHMVRMTFGSYAAECIRQMQAARQEQVQLARALLQELARNYRLELHPHQSLDTWAITGPDFSVSVEVTGIEQPESDSALQETAEAVMVPLMAAMAELIGYEEVSFEVEYDVEGTVSHVSILRRERSPRNRLLCLSIHGHRCMVCGLVPEERYREAGAVIEVHHLEPVSNLAEPRPYDPRTDLIPLCPTCHRAVHTKRPVPYTPEELKEILNRAS